MTIYIGGPDGKPLAFSSDAELEAYRRALREAEPLLLKCLRKHCHAVGALQQQAGQALRQRRGRSAALADIECRLRGLISRMADDIRAGERDVPLPDQTQQLLEKDMSKSAETKADRALRSMREAKDHLQQLPSKIDQLSLEELLQHIQSIDKLVDTIRRKFPEIRAHKQCCAPHSN
jgi:hypothetical protein